MSFLCNNALKVYSTYIVIQVNKADSQILYVETPNTTKSRPGEYLTKFGRVIVSNVSKKAKRINGLNLIYHLIFPSCSCLKQFCLFQYYTSGVILCTVFYMIKVV